MSDKKKMHDDFPFPDLLDVDLEPVDEEEEEAEEEVVAEEPQPEKEQVMVEPVEDDDLQMVDTPTAGNRTVGQTHHKFNQIRQEKPAKKRKYMGRAKSW